MILLLKLAYRNIFRNFRRSLLTFLAITIGVMLSVIFIGFNLGAERQSINLSIQTDTGDLKIYRQGFTDDDVGVTLDYTIDKYAEIEQRLAGRTDIAGYAERILFPASLIIGIDELKLNGIGIDPDH